MTNKYVPTAIGYIGFGKCVYLKDEYDSHSQLICTEWLCKNTSLEQKSLPKRIYITAHKRPAANRFRWVAGPWFIIYVDGSGRGTPAFMELTWWVRDLNAEGYKYFQIEYDEE